MKEPAETTLSVVVVMVGDTLEGRCDTQQLEATLTSLTNQVGAPPMEVIVPYHSRVSGIENLEAKFPAVSFVHVTDLKSFSAETPGREHHDELRARGTLKARGEVIAFLEDHVRPQENWAARIVAAHQKDNAAVIGGAIENHVDRALNWATYFCDLGKYQNPLPKGESSCASLVNASYKRAALKSIESVWRERFNETTVNWTLITHGQKLTLERDVIVYQDRGGVQFETVWKEFFVWGRSYALTRSRILSGSRRLLYGLLVPTLPAVLLVRMAARVIQRGRYIKAFLKALPFTTLMTISWSGGELVGYWCISPISEQPGTSRSAISSETETVW